MGVTLTFISDVERDRRAPFTQARIVSASAFLGIDPEPLLWAAAVERGKIELSAKRASPKRLRVGAGLMRRWAELSDEQLEAIERVLADQNSK